MNCFPHQVMLDNFLQNIENRRYQKPQIFKALQLYNIIV